MTRRCPVTLCPFTGRYVRMLWHLVREHGMGTAQAIVAAGGGEPA